MASMIHYGRQSWRNLREVVMPEMGVAEKAAFLQECYEITARELRLRVERARAEAESGVHRFEFALNLFRYWGEALVFEQRYIVPLAQEMGFVYELSNSFGPGGSYQITLNFS